MSALGKEEHSSRWTIQLCEFLVRCPYRAPEAPVFDNDDLSCDLVLGALATRKPHGRDVVEMRVPRAIVPAESEGHGREKADGLCTHAF